MSASDERRGKPLSDHLTKSIRQLHRQGKSYREIAYLTGVSKWSVSKQITSDPDFRPETKTQAELETIGPRFRDSEDDFPNEDILQTRSHNPNTDQHDPTDVMGTLDAEAAQWPEETDEYEFPSP